jgi:membrane-bound lytic murein transglycosylase B
MMQRIVLIAVACVGACTTAFAVEIDDAAVERARTSFVSRMVSAHDFEAAELEELLRAAEIEPSILEAMSRPAERVMSWANYRALFLTEERITSGAEFWREHAAAIERIADEYGVAPEMLVAILGVETFFGRRTGRYRVLDALATLAFAYPPRSSFFASELESFLLLAREEAVDPLTALGSYAGAMGAGQFIHSSYRAYAVDGDGDGRRDLWASWDDVFGSVANYFKRHGWREGEAVAEQASVPSGWTGEPPTNSLDLDETIGSLRQQGYQLSSELPATTPVSIFRLDEGDAAEYWVGFHNFRVITRYNRSAMYALAVYQLSQAIRQELESGSAAEG